MPTKTRERAQTYDSENVSFLAIHKQTAFFELSIAFHWL